MSGFSAEWLALRESYDLRARNPIVLDAVVASFASLDATNVIDLACGSGSTVRALSPRLPSRQRWDLVDNDQRLLTLACSGKSAGDVRLTAVPLDATIVSAVNAHQRTDKGFGPALGPSATAAAISMFEALGYSVVCGISDWLIGTADREIQLELLAGWATAASEVEALPRCDIDSWLARRKDEVGARASAMRVGHVDFFATPIATR